MPSKTSLFLIASLAVNAALLGIVGGQVVNKQQRRPPPEMQSNRPPQSEVMAAWAQLPDADRTELRKQLRDSWTALEGERKRLSEAGKAVHDVAMKEPFDSAALRDALTIYQQRQRRMQESAEDILISHLSKMPPEARATAAVGLLTPFNARVQRADHSDRGGPSKTRVDGVRVDGKGEQGGDGRPDGPRNGGGPSPSTAGTDGKPQKPPGSPN